MRPSDNIEAHMPSTTHADAFHFDHPVRSFWEASAAPLGLATPPLAGDAQCDVAIIGAGYTGLAAALRLSSEYGLDVRVLEAGEPGWGASGRNGGFACIGCHKRSYGSLIQSYGLDETRRFYGAMKDAVDLVRELCASHGIDAWIHEGGEISLAHLPSRWAELEEERDFMARIFGEKLSIFTVEELKARGLWAPTFHGGIHNATGFSIHPLNYARGLARAVHSAGVPIHGSSRVRRWEQAGGRHRLTTQGGTLTARRVIVATNGYTPEDVSPHHAGRLMPALSNIIVTRPLSEAERAEQGWTSRLMAFDTRNLLHYFRLLPDGRFLFGGRGGTDASDAGAAPMQHHMTATLRRMFPVFGAADITHFWRGFVCLAYDLVPYVGPLDTEKTVWTAIAYHGNGVAMATYSGMALADLIAGDPKRANLPSVLTRRLARFPLAGLRPLYLKGAYLWFNYQDGR
ncbi:FAD-binding oxidoreductase [Nordella sp. HKS 07]|uniref:NAD(P)/FAD-dependent oxidoreductase n=1 Tax=Nordella sp. HKS 07 TaxID=2712222 RepID=UPI0013E16377|nr:FAD-binding oxidoreductase [Nordella sp. HKS 07]QIG47555.1 FAD-binding oxidoreductase [Nordella sp. HKS 07]